MVETAYSANQPLGDEMNVVQIHYGLGGPNTACRRCLAVFAGPAGLAVQTGMVGLACLAGLAGKGGLACLTGQVVWLVWLVWLVQMI